MLISRPPVLAFCLAAGLLTALGNAARAADLPPDLALVPANSVGFIHVRVAEIYRSDSFRDLREVLNKAGADVLRTFNARFAPAPDTIERVTAFVLMPRGDGPRAPEPVIVVHTSQPFDRDRILKGFGVSGPAQDNVATDGGHTALRFVDQRTFAVGSPETIRRLAGSPATGDGPLAAALALAASGGKPLVAAVNAGVVPPQAIAQLPPPLQPLAQVKLATLTVDLKGGTTIDLRCRYADANAATEAERSVWAGLQYARQGMTQARAELEKKVLAPGGPNPAPVGELPEAAAALVGLGALRQADDMLQALPLKREGAELRLSVTLPPGHATTLAATSAVGVGLLLPAVQKVREASMRMQDQNNLKQIALACFNYESAYGTFPPYAIYSKDGRRPLLSWRVAILPYIEQDHLYKQFKLDEPWDSEHNKKLIAQMPPTYMIPTERNRPAGEPERTYYRVFVGGGALFDRGPRGPRLADITDGTSNTLMVVEAAEGVPWTKPEELTYDPMKPLPKLGGHFPGGFNAAFADGSVRFFSTAVVEQTLRALITRAGGEVIQLPGQ